MEDYSLFSLGWMVAVMGKSESTMPRPLRVEVYDLAVAGSDPERGKLAAREYVAWHPGEFR